MRTYMRKICPNYSPLETLPSNLLSETNCKYCSHYSTKNCHKTALDLIDNFYDDLY